jgi:hypothetical protein
LHGDFLSKVGQGAVYFGAGAVQGGLSVLGPTGWLLGGAVAGGVNTVMQGGNFLQGAGIGAVSGFVGGKAGSLAGKYLGGVVINGFHVSAQSALGGLFTGAIGGAGGGYVGGLAAGYMMTGDWKAAHQAGMKGLKMGAGIGAATGAAYGYYSAVRSGRNGLTGRANRSFTIGEGMSTDPTKGWMGVDKIADDLKSDYYKPDPSIPKKVPGYGTTPDLMYDNAVQIEIQMQENVIIYDRGPVGNNSQYYNMEVGRTMNYSNLLCNIFF